MWIWRGRLTGRRSAVSGNEVHKRVSDNSGAATAATAAGVGGKRGAKRKGLHQLLRPHVDIASEAGGEQRRVVSGRAISQHLLGCNIAASCQQAYRRGQEALLAHSCNEIQIILTAAAAGGGSRRKGGSDEAPCPGEPEGVLQSPADL